LSSGLTTLYKNKKQIKCLLKINNISSSTVTADSNNIFLQIILSTGQLISGLKIRMQDTFDTTPAYKNKKQ